MSRPGSGVGGGGGHQTGSHTETDSPSDMEIPACFALECTNGTVCIHSDGVRAARCSISHIKFEKHAYFPC